jgi:hypothetical protein
LAASIVGTHPTRRCRLCEPHGLHSLQSGQAWVCREAVRLAFLDISPRRRIRSVSGGLGGERWRLGGTWGASLSCVGGMRKRFSALHPASRG